MEGKYQKLKKQQTANGYHWSESDEKNLQNELGAKSKLSKQAEAIKGNVGKKKLTGVLDGHKIYESKGAKELKEKLSE